MAKEPAELDWNMTDGNDGAHPCIYKVEKDTLTLCLDPKAKIPPPAFQSPAGSTIALWTLRRVPQKV